MRLNSYLLEFVAEILWFLTYLSQEPKRYIDNLVRQNLNLLVYKMHVSKLMATKLNRRIFGCYLTK